MKLQVHKTALTFLLLLFTPVLFINCSTRVDGSLEKIQSPDGGITKDNTLLETKKEDPKEETLPPVEKKPEKPSGPCCDEGKTRPCYSDKQGTQNVGECRSGLQTCKSCKWSACIGEVVRRQEVCDGKDNNCDGQTDENYDTGKACSVGSGPCAGKGIKMCASDGTKTICSGKAQPGAKEVCDGVDNDCNGKIDDDIASSACYTGTSGCKKAGTSYSCSGQCNIGKSQCSGGKETCVGQVLPSTEICGDGVDNDCNGQVDDVPNLGKACTIGTGNCKSTGKYVCGTGGAAVKCDAAPATGTPEKCDGIDNDCDGKTDEGLGTNSCGKGGCLNYAPACLNGKANKCVPKASTKEVCDNIDNDCDGQTDEGNVCVAPAKGKEFRLSYLAIAAAGEGFDLNGDNKPDNSLAVAAFFANSQLSSAINRGTLNVLVELAGLSDATGQTGTATVYFYMGRKAGNGYQIEKDSLDASNKPLFRFAGNINNRNLQGGPSMVNLQLPLLGVPMAIKLEKAYVKFKIEMNFTSLKNGMLGGAIPAAHLNQIPADSIPLVGGPGKTLLDVMVQLGQQPDVDLDNDGFEKYTIGASGITSCTDGDGSVVKGKGCAKNSKFKDGFSAAFKFEGKPVNVTGIAP